MLASSSRLPYLMGVMGNTQARHPATRAASSLAGPAPRPFSGTEKPGPAPALGVALYIVSHVLLGGFRPDHLVLAGVFLALRYAARG